MKSEVARMKDPFEMLNDVEVDVSDYEEVCLSDVEKKRMKRRVNKKLTKRRHTKRNITVLATAAVAFFCIMTVDMRSMIADIPLIGSKTEEYVNSKEDLKEYTTTVGQTVYDNNVEVRLDEVLLDEGKIIVNSTFKSSSTDLKEAFAWPDIYINGQRINGGGSGDTKKVNDYTYTFFSAIDLRDEELKWMDVTGELNIQVVYRDIEFSNTEDSIKGDWGFSFTASGDKLKADTKIIPIGKKFTLENGQKIEVEDLRISPVLVKLNYKMLNGKELDVKFLAEDQDGNALQAVSGLTLAKESYWRFGKLDESVTSITFTPELTSGEEGNQKTDYYKVLSEESFEVQVN